MSPDYSQPEPAARWPCICKPARYVVISPVRDEEQHLEETIRSMVRQTVRPVQWILVDDGSTDRTSEIIDHWAAQEPWIVAIHRSRFGLCESAGADGVDLPTEASPGKRGMRARGAKRLRRSTRAMTGSLRTTGNSS